MIYNLFIYLYRYLFFVSKNFSPKNQERHLGLQSNQFPSKSIKRIWIHCASAGEYEQAIPLIESLKAHFSIEIFVSFFSPSGMSYYHLFPKADYVFYLPFDTPHQAKKIVENIQADYVIWVRYEFWENILHTIFEKNIPCDLIFVDLQKIEKKSWIEKSRILKLLPLFSNIYSINSPQKIQISHHLIHDGKWQQSLKNASKHFEDVKIQEFCQDQTCIIIGSAHMSDIEILSEYLKKNPEQFIQMVNRTARNR
jgi:3-deoxy-D-manno-octulosonic-acid transferase